VLNVQIFSTTCVPPTVKSWWCRTVKIIAGNIINFSREPARRNEFIIGVAYDADIDR
jgi:small conductance mechanosensitive channel